MVVDCFLYAGESDILQLRFDYLNDYVDYFVIVESEVTFQGNLRQDLFNVSSFKVDPEKIKYYRVPPKKMLDIDGSREKEKFLRNNISLVLKDLKLKDEDIVILSDVDEIPKSTIFSEVIYKPLRLQQRLIYFYANYTSITNPFWASSFIAPFKFIASSDIDDMRFNFSGCYNFPLLQDAGWHFSYYGGIKSIRAKLSSIGDGVEKFKEHTDDYFLKRVESGLDIFGRKIYWTSVDPLLLGFDKRVLFDLVMLKYDGRMNTLYKLARFNYVNKFFRGIYKLAFRFHK